MIVLSCWESTNTFKFDGFPETGLIGKVSVSIAFRDLACGIRSSMKIEGRHPWGLQFRVEDRYFVQMKLWTFSSPAYLQYIVSFLPLYLS